MNSISDDSYDNEAEMEDINSTRNMIGTPTDTLHLSHNNSPDNDTNSQSSSNYEKYLRLATENNQCMILELELNGKIRYITKQPWENIVGTQVPDNIEDLIEGTDQDRQVFKETTDMMLINDNTSYTVTFTTKSTKTEGEWQDYNDSQEGFIILEACGILIHDSKTELPSHTMWIVKPYHVDWHANEIDNILPIEFIKKLGFGATIFAEYLKGVEYDMILNENDLPVPRLELCRVCELYVPAWWLETHSYLCVCEHKIRSVIQLLHDNLEDRLEILQNFKSKFQDEDKSQKEEKDISSLELEYNSVPIKGTRSRAFFETIIDELIDLCNAAININPSEYHETTANELTEQDQQRSDSLSCKNNINLLLLPGEKMMKNQNVHQAEFTYQFSPTSKTNIETIQNWSPDFDLTAENIKDEGLSLLVNETMDIIKKKVDAIMRLDNAMTYNLRIKNEVNSYVLQSVKEQVENNKLKFNHSLNLPLQNSEFATNTGQNRCDADQEQESSQNELCDQIIKPQPRLFTASYLTNNEIPITKTDNISGSKDDNSKLLNRYDNVYENDQVSQINRSSVSEIIDYPSDPNFHRSIRSRSLTPKQRLDYSAGPVSNILLSGQNTSTLSSSSGTQSELVTKNNTPNEVLKNNNQSSTPHSNSSGPVLLPKLSTSISLTPRRGSPLPSTVNHNLNNSRLSNGVIQGASTSYNRSLNMEKSPVISPFSNENSYNQHEHNSITNTLQTINSPTFNHSNLSVSNSHVNLSNSVSSNQPLSPLLLATSQMKPLTPSIKDYDIIKPISKGAYGSVYLARKKLTGDYFAIKVLRKSDMIAKNQVTNVKSERAIMMVQSDKPYVARLYATFQNKDNLFLVMEYLPGGDLATLLKMMGCLPDEWVKQYLSEIIIGVEDMHNNGIIHHDLKPENLLIDVSGHLKLTDFGLSRAGLVKRHRHIPKPISLSNADTRSNIDSHPTSHLSTPEIISLDHRPSLNSAVKNRKRSSLKQDILENNLQAVLLTNEFSAGSEQERLKERFQRNSMDYTPETSSMKRSESQQSFLDISRSSTPPPYQNITSTPMKLRTNSITYAENNFNINEASNSPSTDLILFNPEDSKQDKRFFGTPDYLAPETIEGTGEDNQCDWWSVGCILFEMVFGYPPFHAETPDQVFRNILEGKIDWPIFDSIEEEREYISPEAKDLIMKFLITDPHKRLGYNGTEEIKNHPYFKDVKWDHVYDETASYVPNIEDPEDTDYFDLRGATLQDFGDDNDEDAVLESDGDAIDIGQNPNKFSSHKLSVGSVLESVSVSNKPAHSGPMLSPSIPSHLRDNSKRTGKLNDKQTEFGSFYFRNLSALDKANKDAINRLKSEHLTESKGRHRRTSSSSLVGYISDSSSKLRVSKLGGIATPPVGFVINKANKHDTLGLRSYSPERSISLEATPSSHFNHSSESGKDSNSIHHGNMGSDLDSPSGLKFKSPLSPSTPYSSLNTAQTTPNTAKFNRSRLLSHPNSQRTVSTHRTDSGDLSNEEAERLHAVYRVNSLKYRRKSGRKSSGVNDVGYRMDILVCEPIPIHRYRVTRDLESVGCTVVSVGAGDELVSRANSGVKFDLIVTALKLPKLGAIDIVKLIKHTNGINSRTPIIAITNFYHEAISAKVFDDVLEKPIMLDEIRHLVAKYALKKSQEESTIVSDSDDAMVYQETSS